jgi:hypothetical protein
MYVPFLAMDTWNSVPVQIGETQVIGVKKYDDFSLRFVKKRNNFDKEARSLDKLLVMNVSTKPTIDRLLVLSTTKVQNRCTHN